MQRWILRIRLEDDTGTVVYNTLGGLAICPLRRGGGGGGKFGLPVPLAPHSPIWGQMGRPQLASLAPLTPLAPSCLGDSGASG